MSTLKICTSKVIWIFGIKKIIQLGEFTLEPQEVEYTSDDIRKVAHDKGYIDGMRVVHVVDFEFGNSTFDIRGAAVMIETLEDNRELWLIPRRSAFLMSDSGATIDRI